MRLHQIVQLVFGALSAIVTWKALSLWWAFQSKHTEMFARYGLKDPSLAANPAGYHFGWWISALFLGGMIWGTVLYVLEIVLQTWSADAVSQEWRELGPHLQSGETTEEEALKRLQAKARPRSRVAVALHSWSDASPNSDAEMVIEGQASSCRQQLGVLQTLASVLVLIGLVGNFFGLAEAVQRLPDLAGASVTTPGSAPTPTTREDVKPFGDGVTRHETIEGQQGAAGPTADLSAMKEQVKGISDGLSVVVVSSILGIGGMILLLLYVAGFKAIYNWQVTYECVLLAAEIGSLLRPAHGSGVAQVEAATPVPAESIALLVTTLAEFQPALADCTRTIGQSRDDVLSMAGALEKLVREDLQRANEAAGSNREAFEAFCAALNSQSQQVVRAAEATQGLGDQLKQLAENQGRLADDTDRAFRHYNELLLAHEQYVKNSERAALQSFQELPQTLRTELANVSGKLVEELHNSTHATMGAAQEALRDTRQAIQDTRQQFITGYDRLNAGYEELFRQIHRDLESTLVEGAQKSADAALHSVITVLTPLQQLLDAFEKQRLNLEQEGADALRESVAEVRSLIAQAQALQQASQADTSTRLAEVARAAQQTSQGVAELAKATHDLTVAAQALPQAVGQRSGLTAQDLAEVMERNTRSLRAKLNELKPERSPFFGLPSWWPGRQATRPQSEEN